LLRANVRQWCRDTDSSFRLRKKRSTSILLRRVRRDELLPDPVIAGARPEAGGPETLALVSRS
jgi:hypothetical protein